MAVETVLTALADKIEDYELIRDCVAGQRQIKKRGTKYLFDPDPLEPDENERKARYASYLGRAVFYGATGRTLRGLVGLVMDKDPATEIPERLKILEQDVDGAGTTMNQQATSTLSGVVSLGRRGLFTEYPVTNGQVTVQAEKEGNIRPTILAFEPEQIINWRTRTVGGKVLLSLVVLKETIAVEDDGFAETTVERHRVLKLDAQGNYVQEIHTADQVEIEVRKPTDGKGQPFKEIPFEFIGSLDNTPAVDYPPLLDLAELNIAHYRNSADYEESAFVMGQPTPVVAGVTTQWVKDVFKGKIRFGSRGAIALPVGGSAELLQVEPNTLAFEAMGHKEAQMIALGAKLIENTGTVQTATEATIDTVMDNSILGTCARNTSLAYVKCLNWAWQFLTGEVKDDPEFIDYELNTDFASRMLSAEDRSEIIKEWQAKAISFEEMRWNLKRSGVAYLDDEEAKEQIESETEASIEMEAAAANALGQATGQVDEDGQPIPKPVAPGETKPPAKKTK